jgi:hypothetical protein
MAACVMLRRRSAILASLRCFLTVFGKMFPARVD